MTFDIRDATSANPGIKVCGRDKKGGIMKLRDESGFALIMALMLTILMGAILQLFIARVISSQRMIAMDMWADRPGASRITVVRDE